tara:strand:+ start:1752 stop:2096 length:345 start_codon:yes stop_codon:yes gene_type:complete
LCVSSRRASEQQHKENAEKVYAATKSQMCDLWDFFLCKVRYKNKIPFSPLTKKSTHLFGKGKKNIHCTDKERTTMEASDDDRSSHGLTCHTAPVRFIDLYYRFFFLSHFTFSRS